MAGHLSPHRMRWHRTGREPRVFREMTYNTSNLCLRPLIDRNYPISDLFVQQKDTVNSPPIADISELPKSGRIVALDPGTLRIGVAICDELRVTTRPLKVLT